MAVRSRCLAAVLAAVGLLAGGASPAYAARHRDRCRYEHCGDRYGDGGSGGGQGASGGDYEGGQGGDTDQRGDHNCRNFCFYGIPAPGQGGQQPQSVACLVPVPWHCDQKPSGFIPPNPGKIPQQIADFVKVVGDFVQSVIRFAI